MGVGAAMWAAAAIAAASAVSSNVQANKQASAQAKATRQAERQAEKQAETERQNIRRQNTNNADISSILSQNANSAGMGNSTLLTGAGGVNKNDLSLGGGGTLG